MTQYRDTNTFSNSHSNSHIPTQQVVSSVKGRYRLTMFRPRHDAKYGNRIVDETKFLGSFKSVNGINWLRLSACVAVNPESGQKAQWGRILAYRGLVAPLVKAIVDTESGRFITLNVDAKMEVVLSNGYANTVWTIYGFEYNGSYYTTKNGDLTVGPILSEEELRQRGGNNSRNDGDDMFAKMERELGGVANAAGHSNVQRNTHQSSHPAARGGRTLNWGDNNQVTHLQQDLTQQRTYVPREDISIADLDEDLPTDFYDRR